MPGTEPPLFVQTRPALTHPTALRAEFKARESDTPPSPELTIAAPTRLSASIEQVAPVAARVNKLVSMAERGAAMWLAENWAEVQQADAPLSKCKHA